MNGGRGNELAITRRVGLGCKAYNSMSSILCGKIHMEYQEKFIEHVRPVMKYGSKTWVVRSVEKSIL